MRPLFNLHYSLVRWYYNGIRRACSFESQNLWQSTFWTCCNAADKAAAAAAAADDDDDDDDDDAWAREGSDLIWSKGLKKYSI